MSHPIITGGKLRTLGIGRPNVSTIIRLATVATLNGFGLDGDGPIKRVTGSKLTVVVGPTGCICAVWRNGEFCHHAALFIVETGTNGRADRSHRDADGIATVTAGLDCAA